MRKRKLPAVRVENSRRLWARYQGVIDPHIAVSSAAVELWPGGVLQAALQHELAHHLRYHVELKLGAPALAVISCLIAPAWVWAPLVVLTLGPLSLLIEFDADRQATRAGAQMQEALEFMLVCECTWFQRRQLGLRLQVLKWARKSARRSK